MADYSFIANAHPSFIEALYVQYQKEPNSVEEEMNNHFQRKR